ncbi:hypothetical protein LP421_10595 [Rhizobium sp. RCAM05350]|nr:hypothetical protein LP421_10595 [Rhizobium sp. RCAM05350]
MGVTWNFETPCFQSFQHGFSLINNQDIANGDYDIHWLENYLAKTAE